MCLMPGCRNPVAGKLLFEHWELHLKPWERRWLDEDIESPNWIPPPKDDSEHPMTTQLKEALEVRDKELVKEIFLRKEKALADANELIEKARGLESERRAFLPEKLRRRLYENSRAQQEETGYGLDDSQK